MALLQGSSFAGANYSLREIATQKTYLKLFRFFLLFRTAEQGTVKCRSKKLNNLTLMLHGAD